MKAKVKLLLLLTVVLLIMGGCVKVEALPEFEMYEKSSLHIAVIGEKPVVREKILNLHRLHLMIYKM